MESAILGVILDSIGQAVGERKAVVPVYPITSNTAELVGKISGESAAKGVTVPFEDLLIGACALERGFAVATRNQRHFLKIPGLTLIAL
jgi:predicted nucleic acid-binding protein